MSVDDPRVAPWAPPAPFRPYPNAAVNELYALLFADDGRRLEAAGPVAVKPAGPADDAEAFAREAFDGHLESRLRAIAYRRLRSANPGHPGLVQLMLPLLGVVVEVGLEEGLDVLAAYADRRVRYINHTGAMSIIEDETLLAAEVDPLLTAASRVVQAIGPWDGTRRQPPGTGSLRLSFLVGDLLMFGEGPIDALSRDAMAGPVFAAAGQLLQRIVALPGEQARAGRP